MEPYGHMRGRRVTEGGTTAATVTIWIYVGTASPQGQVGGGQVDPCSSWFRYRGWALAGGPVLAPICQGSWTGGSKPRPHPISSRPAGPAAPFLRLYPAWMALLVAQWLYSLSLRPPWGLCLDMGSSHSLGEGSAGLGWMPEEAGLIQDKK